MLNHILKSFVAATLFLVATCANVPDQQPTLQLGDGVISANVTSESAVLQTRLSEVGSVIQPSEGFVRFEWSKNKNFNFMKRGPWQLADSTSDSVVQLKIHDLEPNTRYYFRPKYGARKRGATTSLVGTFKTQHASQSDEQVSFIVASCLRYIQYTYSPNEATPSEAEKDGFEGYIGLATIEGMRPDFVIFNGDNVYYDNRGPVRQFITEIVGMRGKYREHLSMPRFQSLLASTSTIWLKDDHDYRVDDAYPQMDYPLSHELGVAVFDEQLPSSRSAYDLPYHRTKLSKDVELWILEGRDFRSANTDPDTPEKTIWGLQQKSWLKSSLLESEATYKIIITPTPMIGPDSSRKRDNHTNIGGFQSERDEFFSWLSEQGFADDDVYLITGDRHWQYHATAPSGYQEFSAGALHDSNAFNGLAPGDAMSTDPEGLVKHHYFVSKRGQEYPSGGFLSVKVSRVDNVPTIEFLFYDELGELQYKYDHRKPIK